MLPQKLFFRIGEVAGLVGVEPHVLRYWEREFRSIRPTKSAKGQRVYSRKDVENLLRVRDLLYRDGFTIAGAKKKLQRGDANGDSAVAASDAGLSAAPASARAAAEDGAHLSRTAEEHRVVSELAVEAAPASSQPASSDPLRETSTDHVRQKLLALRSEVEAFLAELSVPSPQR